MYSYSLYPECLSHTNDALKFSEIFLPQDGFYEDLKTTINKPFYIF